MVPLPVFDFWKFRYGCSGFEEFYRYSTPGNPIGLQRNVTEISPRSGNEATRALTYAISSIVAGYRFSLLGSSIYVYIYSVVY